MDARDGEFTVDEPQSGERLDRLLKAHRPTLSWSKVRDLVARGFVLVDDTVVCDAGLAVGAGRRVRVAVGHVEAAAPRAARPALPAECLVHVDRDVAVVDKPAGLPTVPFEDEREPTLDRLLAEALGGRPVHVVQRLDRDTSGLLVFARNRDAEHALAQQLRFRTMHRRYRALVHGRAEAGTIRTFLAEDRGDGLRGSTRHEKAGKLAVTHVDVVERLAGATLVACRLETGRTHQIRIHLAEQGHMLLGERAYVREHVGPVLPAPRVCLHAAELGFEHPRGGGRLAFERGLPSDVAAVLARLRRA